MPNLGFLSGAQAAWNALNNLYTGNAQDPLRGTYSAEQQDLAKGSTSGSTRAGREVSDTPLDYHPQQLQCIGGHAQLICAQKALVMDYSRFICPNETEDASQKPSYYPVACQDHPFDPDQFPGQVAYSPKWDHASGDDDCALRPPLFKMTQEQWDQEVCSAYPDGVSSICYGKIACTPGPSNSSSPIGSALVVGFAATTGVMIGIVALYGLYVGARKLTGWLGDWGERPVTPEQTPILPPMQLDTLV